jgi:hypothetical protein
MTVVLFGVGLVTLAATALLAAASLRLASPVQTLLGAYLIGSAEAILLGEALSLARGVSAWGYLGGEAAALVGAAAVWRARGRPPLAVPQISPAAVRRHPIVLALGVVVGAAVVYQAILVLSTPPNNWDSMTYHLSRVAYWFQHGGIAYVPDAHTQRQNAFPPNSELEILYTFAFLRSDLAAVLPQLAAEGALLLAVVGLARRLDFSRAAAVLAGLLTATLAQVALQSTTTQNDLTVAALVAACAYFLLGRTGPELALAGIALALAAGTKPTVLFAFPSLIALAALSLPTGRVLVRAAATAVVAFVLLGAYGYVLNLVETGRILGDSPATRPLRPRERTVDGTVSTVARVVYRLVDLSGFRQAATRTAPIERAGEAVFDAAGIPPNPPETTARAFSFKVNVHSDPDLSFFGPLGALLVLPLALAFTWTWRRSPLDPALALSLPMAILAIAFTYRYNDFVGRFVLVAIGLVMPFAAWLYGRRLLAAVVAVIAALSLVLTHAYDRAKPTGLAGSTPVWRLSRSRAQTLTRPELSAVLVEVERRIPERAHVGVLLGEDDWDYPLYGPSLDRRLVSLPRLHTLAEAERRGLRWVVVGVIRPGPAYLPGWAVRFFPDSQWTLLHRDDFRPGLRT